MLFWQYLKDHKKGIAAGALFCGIFAVVFWLYRLPVQAVLYPVALCLLLGVLFLLADYIRARRKHNTLLCICGMRMIEELPVPERMDDRDYQAVIRALQREIRCLETDNSRKYQDMVDYYTIWAHQIKTPIASMRLHLQNEDTAVSRQLQSDLQRIEQYVEMVLAFLRLDSASHDYVFRQYELDTIIKQAVKRFSSEFIGRKIRLIYTPVEKAVVTDEKWLLFVLEQILSNALKYTGEGSICIYTETPDTLCIRDTGIGIAPSDLPRIFENGYTGYNGRRDKKASGIGLYLCKRICDGLGIAISAESQLGQGTTLKLRFGQK